MGVHIHGGPLLNLQGQVIGVNSQIATATGANTGVGYAVPGNLARQVVESLITRGEMDYSYIGISGRDLALPHIDSLGLPDNTRGILVREVVAAGPAERARLVEGDIITAVNGTPLKSMNELITYLAHETAPGDSINLSILRLDANGDSVTTVPLNVTVTLRGRP